MVALLWDTALIMLCAYFLGAMLGCMTRRLLFPGTLAAASGTGARQQVPAPAVRAQPSPSRFEKALTGESLVAQRAEVERGEIAAAAARSSEQIAPQIEQIAPKLADRGEPMRADAVKSVDPVAASSVETAAGDTRVRTTRTHLPPLPPADLAAAAMQRGRPGATNDLREIRAIDDKTAKAMAAHGVRRWSDIAAWTAADVDRIEKALGVPGRVSAENWIEQASILAVGGTTVYAARRALGLAATTAPTPDVGASRAPVRPSVRPAPSEPAPDLGARRDRSATSVATSTLPVWPDPVPNEAAPSVAQTEVGSSSAWPVPAAMTGGVATATAAALAATSSLANRRNEPVVPAPPVVPPETPAPRAEVREEGTDRWRWDAASLRDRSAIAPAAVASAAAAAAAVVNNAPVQPATTPTVPHDDLTLIEGIDGDTQRLLHATGVRRFEQIADWSPEETARFDRLFGAGRVGNENWIAQAQRLSGWTAVSGDVRESDRPTGPSETSPAAATSRGAQTLAMGAAAAATAARGLIGLRSVRSEALVGAQPAARSYDDLKRIRGLGVRDETRLAALGVTSYEQIANWTAAEVGRFSLEIGGRKRIERENWIEQARILAWGEETAFSRRLDDAGETSDADHRSEGAAPAVVASSRPVERNESASDTQSDALKGAALAAAAAAAKSQVRITQPDDGRVGNREPEATDSNEPRATELTAEVAMEPVAETLPVREPALTEPATQQPRQSFADRLVAIQAMAVDDDLKRIRGIGVLIEKRLNAMGVTTYEQIANWTSADIERVSRELSFKGRIEREYWIEQARILASGGQTEFSRRVDHGDV